jgi:hypothetical protein
LNPEARTTWVKDKSIKLRVANLWEQYCREHHSDFVSYERLKDQRPSLVNRFEELRMNLKEKHVQRPQSQDEFENYCSESPSYGLHIPPVEWWLQDSQKKRWPRLSLWAIEVLSIPSMSDKPERVFSGSRRTVSWDKTALSAEMLEQLECGRDWKRGTLLVDNF